MRNFEILHRLLICSKSMNVQTVGALCMATMNGRCLDLHGSVRTLPCNRSVGLVADITVHSDASRSEPTTEGLNMAHRDYFQGRDDFEYQGYASPPRCDRGDQKCCRAQRDYEDGYETAERECEEQHAMQRAHERRLQEEREEELRWEQHHQKQIQEETHFTEYEYCEYMGHEIVPVFQDDLIQGLTQRCCCGAVIGYARRILK